MSTSNKPELKWKVGDPVVISRPTHYYGGEPTIERTTVARVARKYFYIGQEKGRWDEEGYEIETGTQKPRDPNFTNYLAHAYTPAEWEEKRLRDVYLARIRELGKELDTEVHWSWSGQKKWTTARLRQLVVLLECVVADGVDVNLDS